MLIFWDIDGTLMNCGADGTEALNRTFLKMYGVGDAFARAGIGAAMDSVIIERIIAETGLKDVDTERLKTEYAAALELVLRADAAKRALPGARALLDYARAREGWSNLLLTSNFRVGAEAKLRSVGLWEYFSDPGAPGGFGDFSGEKWDAAEDAVRAAGRLAGRFFLNGEICVVGDSLYDARCAKRLGCRHIAVATGWTSRAALEAEGADYVFGDLADTPRVIAALEGF